MLEGKDQEFKWWEPSEYGTAVADNLYFMSNNVEVESLTSGWYTVGIDSNPYGNVGPPSDESNFNLHVYSAYSHVHFYDGDTVVSQEQDSEYVAPDPTPITDDGVEPIDPADTTDDGEECTAAGCDGGGVVGPDDGGAITITDTTTDETISSADDLLGDYVNTMYVGPDAEFSQYVNDWHYVTISWEDDVLVWTNKAGATWSLFYDAAAGTVTTGEDCPYGEVTLTVLDDGTLINTGD